MAESKITHAGGLKLPEPKWLTLEALAVRWTRMSGTTYDINYLLSQAVDMRLQISLYCPLVIPHVLKPRIKMTEVRYRTKQGIPESGVFGISPFDIERLLAGEVFAPDSVLPNSVLTFDSETSNVVFVPTADNTLKVENLIVTREEIERFEQYNFQPGEAAVQSEEAAPEEPAAPSKAAPEKTCKVFTAPDGRKGQKQEAAVLFWIAYRQWSPQAVPDGEKGTIEMLCKGSEETKHLFTAETAFGETWKRLRANNRVRMENHDSYAHRRK